MKNTATPKYQVIINTDAVDQPTFEARCILLDSHSIETRVIDGHLEALEVIFDRDSHDVSQWVDVTSMTRAELYCWLGY